jgi:hypothetical protein
MKVGYFMKSEDPEDLQRWEARLALEDGFQAFDLKGVSSGFGPTKADALQDLSRLIVRRHSSVMKAYLAIEQEYEK